MKQTRWAGQDCVPVSARGLNCAKRPLWPRGQEPVNQGSERLGGHQPRGDREREREQKKRSRSKKWSYVYKPDAWQPVRKLRNSRVVSSSSSGCARISHVTFCGWWASGGSGPHSTSIGLQHKTLSCRNEHMVRSSSSSKPESLSSSSSSSSESSIRPEHDRKEGPPRLLSSAIINNQ